MDFFPFYRTSFTSKLPSWINTLFNLKPQPKIEESPNIFTFKEFMTGTLCVYTLFTIAWVISVFIQDITMIDFCWGFGLAIQSFYYFQQTINYTGEISFTKFLFSFLIFVNGIRLGCYLIVRSRNKPEDKRYQFIRSKIGKYFWLLSYFIIFAPQMNINSLLGLAIYEFNNANNKPINTWLYTIGISLMFSGTLFQSIADYQLYVFKTNLKNKAKVFHNGLWSLCRHPNYFGDTLNWWGIYICNLSINVHFTIICPLIFTTGILFVQGIPMLEYIMKRDRGKDYLNYINNVSSFVPWIFNTGKYQEIKTNSNPETFKKNKKTKKNKQKYTHHDNKYPNKNRHQIKSLSYYLNQCKRQNKNSQKNLSKTNYQRVQ
jgi:steroid 5-alpha reductase family enzyme